MDAFVLRIISTSLELHIFMVPSDRKYDKIDNKEFRRDANISFDRISDKQYKWGEKDMKINSFTRRLVAASLSFVLSFVFCFANGAPFMAAGLPGNNTVKTASPSSATKASASDAAKELLDEDGFLLDAELENDIEPLEEKAGIEKKELADKDKKTSENKKAVEMPEFLESKTVDGVTVTVSAPEGVFPEGAELSVKKVSSETMKQEIDASIREEDPDALDADEAYHFDIKVLYEGKEIEPDTEEDNVKVEFEIDKKVSSENSVEVYHVSGTAGKTLTAELMDSNLESFDLNKEDDSIKPELEVLPDGRIYLGHFSLVNEGTESTLESTTVSVDTDSFSFYVLFFRPHINEYELRTWGNDYYKKGNTALLSQVVKYLDAIFQLEDIIDVKSKNPELLSVQQANNLEWVITALTEFEKTPLEIHTKDGKQYIIDIDYYESASYKQYWGINDEGVLKISNKELPAEYKGGAFGKFNALDEGSDYFVRPNNVWYFDSGEAPWKEYKDQVKKIEVGGPDDIVKIRPYGSSLDRGAYFNGFQNLESADLRWIDTSLMTRMDFMFAGCSQLKSLDLSSFDTSNVTDMGAMFSGCRQLSEVNLSSFDTSNVTNMWRLFYGCRNLKELDLTSFSTKNVTDMSTMFQGCRNLKTIYAGDGWSIEGLDSPNVQIFADCRSLRGEKGTTTANRKMTARFAHIDGGIGNPGLFSRKGNHSKKTATEESDSDDDDYAATVGAIDQNGRYLPDTYPDASWVRENYDWYLQRPNGRKVSGWAAKNGKWYYLDPGSRKMCTGWLYLNSLWYHLGPTGAMETGWIQIDGKWYYLFKNGSLAVNTTTPDGYYVNEKGEWIRAE